MAKVTPSPLFSSITGQLGSLCFVRWRHDVNYVKSMPVDQTDPNTERQQVIRDIISTCASAWRTLDQSQRDLWETYALSKPYKAIERGGQYSIIKGNTGTGSGYHCFVSTNAVLISAQLTYIEDAPLLTNPPTAVIGFACSWDTDHFIISWTEPTVHEDGAVVRVWAFSPQAYFHRQIVGYKESVVGSIFISAANGALGASVPFTSLPLGSQVFFQCDVINPSGKISMPSNTISGLTA